MPRTARLNLSGGLFHVISRFARAEWLLDGDGARRAYLSAIQRAAEPDDAHVLAYCMMSSHVHLVLRQGTAPLSRFMKSVNTSFASFVNRGRGGGAAGPVFAGRPRMLLVEGDAHLLELVRYVHNNPVRGSVVSFARHTDWSSHRAYTGLCAGPEWLRMGYVLQRFGRSAPGAKFDAFVDAGRADARRPEWSGARDTGEATAVRSALGDGHRRSDGVLGTPDFVERVLRDAERVKAPLGVRGTEHRAGAVGRPSLREVADAVLAYFGIEPMAFDGRPKARVCAQAKRMITWLWVHEYDGQQVDVARMLEVETSTVSRHYRDALMQAGDFDEVASAIVAWLRERAKPRPRTQTMPAADGLAVRYFVDVDET